MSTDSVVKIIQTSPLDRNLPRLVLVNKCTVPVKIKVKRSLSSEDVMSHILLGKSCTLADTLKTLLFFNQRKTQKKNPWKVMGSPTSPTGWKPDCS